MTNPPSVPSLDVEACVNPERLRNLADRILNMADGRADRDPASLRREAEFVRALASALPGMGKDSEAVAALTAENAQLRETLTLGLGEQESVIAGLRAENERLTERLRLVDRIAAGLPSSRETTDG